MTRLLKPIFLISWCLGLVSCGLWTPEYRDYTQPGDTAAPLSAECTAALAEFTAQVEPALDKTCVTCHAATAIAGTKLAPQNPTNNRKAIVAYASGSTDRFFNHYASDSHGGTNQKAALPKANVDAWFLKEAACK